MVRTKHANRTDAQWLDIITECRNSGFSDKVWCSRMNIPASSFYSAVSRLQKKASLDVPQREFHVRQEKQQVVPLTIIDETCIEDKSSAQDQPVDGEMKNDTAVTLKWQGITVEIRNHAGSAVIRNTLSALQELC